MLSEYMGLDIDALLEKIGLTPLQAFIGKS
jgi:hypothetical protein